VQLAPHWRILTPERAHVGTSESSALSPCGDLPAREARGRRPAGCSNGRRRRTDRHWHWQRASAIAIRRVHLVCTRAHTARWAEGPEEETHSGSDVVDHLTALTADSLPLALAHITLNGNGGQGLGLLSGSRQNCSITALSEGSVPSRSPHITGRAYASACRKTSPGRQRRSRMFWGKIWATMTGWRSAWPRLS
jgi:hypothetical protein